MFESITQNMFVPVAGEETRTKEVALGQHTELSPFLKDEEGIRGVFAPCHRGEILFSQEIEIHTAQLPRRKPQVNFDRLSYDTDAE